nr:MAG TPA: hypothetical protein [Caudoviricetes sp.]
MIPPLRKTACGLCSLLGRVQDNPAISASARRRVARRREDRQAILTNLRFCGAGVLQTYSFPLLLGWAARPPVPQSRRRRCPNRAQEVTLCESKTGGWRS